MSAQRLARLLICLVGMAASAPGMAQGSLPVSPLSQHGEVPYVTGGVGDDELAQIREQAAGHNVKILFAEQGGAYLSGVSATISASGKPPLLNIASGGPYLLVKLPPGTYEIKATHNELSQVRRFSVSSKGRSEMTLRW